MKKAIVIGSIILILVLFIIMTNLNTILKKICIESELDEGYYNESLGGYVRTIMINNRCPFSMEIQLSFKNSSENGTYLLGGEK